MPLLAYLWKVGAALLLLLFVADYCVPRAPIPEQAPSDRPAIRIHSDRKWPERIVFDTRSPTIVAAVPAVNIPDFAISSDVTELPVNRMDNPTVANALAMLPRPVRARLDPSTASDNPLYQMSPRGRVDTSSRKCF